jgi:hypothetical protein
MKAGSSSKTLSSEQKIMVIKSERKDNKVFVKICSGEVTNIQNDIKSKNPGCKVIGCKWIPDVKNTNGNVLQLKIHAAVEHKGLLVCDTCLSMFKTKSEREIHIDRHHRMHCNICGFKCYNKTELKVHCTKTHTVEPEIVESELQICVIPGCTWFIKYTNYNDMHKLKSLHWEECHKDVVSCPHCLIMFADEKEKHEHNLRMHLKICVVCAFECSSDDLLLSHCIKRHTVSNRDNIHIKNKGPFMESRITCSIKGCRWSAECKGSAKFNLPELSLHVSKCHNGMVVCYQCAKLFKNKQERAIHIDKEHFHTCVVCDFKTVNDVYLTRHCLQVHHVRSDWFTPSLFTKPPEKTPCNNNIDDNNPVEDITNTTTKISCDVCNCKFFSNAKLIDHCALLHLVHSDLDMTSVNVTTPIVRILKCTLCHKQFVTLEHLKRHYFISHKTEAKKNISQNPNVSTSRYYVCTVCPHESGIYRTRYFFKQHLKKCHNLRTNKIQEFTSKNPGTMIFQNWYTTIAIDIPTQIHFELRFECQLCEDFYHDFSELAQHYKLNHGKHCCTECNLILGTENESLIHFNEVHIGQCEVCDYITGSSTTLKKHTRRYHRDVYNKMNEERNKPDEISMNVTCTLCYMEVNNRINMKMHYFWFHKKHACEYCWTTFTSPQFEYEHFLALHRNECVHCNKKFQTALALTRHLKSAGHSDDKQELCEICGDLFDNRDAFERHRINCKSKKNVIIRKKVQKIQQREYFCDFCNYRFVKKQHLKRHIIHRHSFSKNDDSLSENYCKICKKQYKCVMLHIAKKHSLKSKNRSKFGKHKCKNCDRSYASFAALQKHNFRHHSFKIYKCNQCPMEFEETSNLDEHVMELHTNHQAFSCAACDKVFLSMSEHEFHMTIHSPESQSQQTSLLPVLRCDLCNEYCLNRIAMEKHIKTRHIRRGKLINVRIKRKRLNRKPYINKN